MSKPVLVSVIIPTYHRHRLLSRCLEALSKQTLAPSLFEIIVVDDGRSFRTGDTVLKFALKHENLTVRYLVPHGTRGPAAARNRGWRASGGTIIAFTDDDAMAQPQWLERGLDALTGDLVAVGGRIVVPLPPVPTDHERSVQGLERAEFATANVFVRRAALEAVGGFDERFTRAYREDSDLHFALLSRCGPVGWTDQAVVVHPPHPAPWGVSLRKEANVYFDALLKSKYPRLFRQKIGRRCPTLYYFIVASTVGALSALATERFALFAALGALAVAGVALFAAKRLRGTDRSRKHVLEIIVTSFAIPFVSLYWRLAGTLRFRMRLL